MSRFHFYFLACLVFPTLTFAQSTTQLSAEAQRAYLTGDLQTARAKFSTVLQIDPANVTARNYLRMIVAQEKGGSPLAKQLQALVLQSVKFQDATFSTALEFLKQQAAKQSVTVSFVSQLPAEAMENKVTLNLTNIPFLEVVRYLCELNHAKAAIEKYAIVIRQISAEPAAASSPAQ